VVATNVVLYTAPHLVPGAAIRPAAAAFTAGLVIMAAGLLLRGWSFRTLGQCLASANWIGVVPALRLRPQAPGPARLVNHRFCFQGRCWAAALAVWSFFS
jgi:hypothetical protein